MLDPLSVTVEAQHSAEGYYWWRTIILRQSAGVFCKSGRCPVSTPITTWASSNGRYCTRCIANPFSSLSNVALNRFKIQTGKNACATVTQGGFAATGRYLILGGADHRSSWSAPGKMTDDKSSMPGGQAKTCRNWE
jgi:hypothetical protein